MKPSARNELALEFGAIASAAGRFIVEQRPHAHVSAKPDGSPVSDADVGAEDLIRARLDALMPGVPVLGEESYDPKRQTTMPSTFLLVDPIDGTRDFLAGRNYYTVNIALIEAGAPIVGCVYAPAFVKLYSAGADAFCAEVAPGDALSPSRMQMIRTAPYPEAGLRAVFSRSHLDGESSALLDRLPIASRLAAGSSIKFCMIAEGSADIYPRLGPTMEWDTAAGHAVLLAAGGRVLARDGAPLAYGKVHAGFRNDGFVAWGREPLPGC